jgi:hypothetical protein
LKYLNLLIIAGMKKVILIAMFSIALGSMAFAQKWYLGIGGGYGFPVAGIGGSSTTQTSFNSETVSFGEGADFGAYGGYMFMKNMGIELGVSYHMGVNNTLTNTSEEYTPPGVGTQIISTETENFSGNMLRLIPAVRMQADDGHICPYVVFGGIIGLAPSATYNETYSNQGNVSQPFTFSGGYSFGFHGALGVKFIVSSDIAIFAECAVNYQEYVPAKGVEGSETVSYVKSYTYGSASPYINNYTNTETEPQVHLPFSSVGANAGILISIGKSGAASKPAATDAKPAATPAPAK